MSIESDDYVIMTLKEHYHELERCRERLHKLSNDINGISGQLLMTNANLNSVLELQKKFSVDIEELKKTDDNIKLTICFAKRILSSKLFWVMIALMPVAFDYKHVVNLIKTYHL
jgi:hypothetical protein